MTKKHLRILEGLRWQTIHINQTEIIVVYPQGHRSYLNVNHTERKNSRLQPVYDTHEGGNPVSFEYTLN